MKTIATEAGQSGQAGEPPLVEAPIEAREGSACPMLLERFLPNADIVESRHIVVNATPDVVWAALKSVDFARIDSPLVRAFMKLRIFAVRNARRRLGLRPLHTPERFTLENVEDYGQMKLAERPGAEIVIGAIMRLFDVESLFERRTPAEFIGFDCPGYIKAAAGFLVEPYGERRTLLSYETRMRATDTKTRAELFLKMLLMAPLMKLTMRRLVRFVKRTAEKRCAAARRPQSR